MGRKFLKLEVKGLSQKEISIELTPNEYSQMLRNKDTYRICVVTNALIKPKLTIFSFSPERKRWEDDDGNPLVIKEIVSARMNI